MNHFLVRLGKAKHIKYAVPIISSTISIAYCTIQFSCHGYLREIFSGQSPYGDREKISNHLRNLIFETQDVCVKNGWCNVTNYLFKDLPRGKIKWFSSSTLEPITYGSAYFDSGLLIGLPTFYNYTKTDDIPKQVFEIKRIALIRSAHDQLQEEKSKIQDEGIAIQGEAPSIFAVRKIDRESDEGLDYADTLVLSDDAKRFSIAREMFYGDSCHSIFKVSLLAISLIMASSFGRAFVSIFKLREYHVTYRLAGYSFGGACGFVNFKGLGFGLDQYYAKLADDRAKDLGANYKIGAEEYYNKRARRRNILGLN